MARLDLRLPSRTLRLLLPLALLAAAGPAQAFTIELIGEDRGGYGQHGLYLGRDARGYEDVVRYNWEFTDVRLKVRKDGSAVVWGEMERLSDRMAYPDLELPWQLHIELSDPSYEGGVRGLHELKDATHDGAGMAWQHLELRLEAPAELPYETKVPLDGWTGYAAPDMGYPYPAELLLEDGVWQFDAWYERLHWDQRYYEIGDTQAVIRYEKPIPEPTAALTFAVGVLLVGRALRPRA